MLQEAAGGRALEGFGGASLPHLTKPRMPAAHAAGVRRRGLSSVVERETAQIAG